MSKIKLLPEQLINQIAAGEVVERPASVVKELIENSVDAGASRVVVEVSKGGIDLIKITDNGCGMSQEDALMSLERHATSKIATLEDLHQVRTMGFRGEAMASIASVSRLKIRTRLASNDHGTEVEAEGGVILKVSPIGCPEGTEIEVRELFFNTPARLKFLKSEQTEYQNIVDALLNAALVFPGIAFRLINEGKQVFDLPATEDELVRLRGVLGKGIVEEMIPIFYGGVLLNMTGYIGKPSLTRANKNMQYFFVNNRPINSYVLAYAIKQAFHALIPKERYPVFVVKFDLDPSMVDVNCHPRKTEVKFTDEREVYRVLAAACTKALEENVLTPKMVTGTSGSTNYYQEKRPEGLAQLTLENLSSGVSTTVKVEEMVVANSGEAVTPTPWKAIEPVIFAQSASEKTSNNATDQPVPTEMKVLGQLNKSFILCQRGQDLLIIDQHAAHERIRYNKLISEHASEEKIVQPLLMPITVELSQQDVTILNSNKAALEAVGVELEHFGGNTFAIKAVPAFLARSNLEKVLQGLLDDFRAGFEPSSSGDRFKGDLFARKEKILTYLACRSAVKFGDSLTQEEMVALVNQLDAQIQGKNTCPHGRPTMIVLEEEELWNRFGRKYTGFFEKEKFRDVNC